jgi:RHS repeat-associated protein
LIDGAITGFYYLTSSGEYPFGQKLDVYLPVAIGDYPMNSTHQIEIQLLDKSGVVCPPSYESSTSGAVPIKSETIIFKRVSCIASASLSSDKPLFKPINNEIIDFGGMVGVAPSNTSTTPPDWSLAITTADGTTVASSFGTGTTVFKRWDGKNGSGSLVLSGTYTASLTGTSKDSQCSKTQEIAFKVSNFKIISFSPSKEVLDPFAGEKVNLEGNIYEDAGRQVNWTITIRDSSGKHSKTLSGNDLEPKPEWDGTDDNGFFFDPGLCTATLVAQTSDGDSDSKTLQVKVLQGPKMCLLEKNSGSTTNVATGNLSHSQELFSTKGVAHPIDITLSYKSLDSRAYSLGVGWSHNYDIALEENGDTVLFREGNQNKLFTLSGGSYQPQADDTSTLAHDPSVGTWTMSRVDGTAYNFETADDQVRLASIVDRNGNHLDFGYPSNDRTTITDTAGRSVTFTYDTTITPKRLTAITDPNQKTYTFVPDGNGRLSRIDYPVTDSGAAYWEYTYKGSTNLLESKRDPENKITSYYYNDTTGRMESVHDPEWTAGSTDHSRGFAYETVVNGSERTSTFTEKDGGTWSTTYDTKTGAVTSETDPNGKITYYYYNADANKTLKAKSVPFDTGKWFTTFYAYDSHGNVLYQADPVDLSTIIPAIDPKTVDVTTFGDAASPIKWAQQYTYDYVHNDRIHTTSDLRGTTPLTTTYNYSTGGDGGEVATVIAPGNLATITRYNPNGTIRESIDANNTVVAADGTVTEKVGAKKTVFTYYDTTDANKTTGKAGLLWTTTGPDGVVTTYSDYEKNGNNKQIQIKDVDGTARKTIDMDYDARNRLKTSTVKTTDNPLGFVTTYGYDKNDNMTSVIDPEQHETKYEYNYNRQVTKVTDAKLNDTVYTYGATGCPSCGGGVDKLTGVYDAKVAKLVPLESQPHTAYSYDQLGRLHYQIEPIGSDSIARKIKYTYYDSGKIRNKYDATASDPGNVLATYAYNNRGEVRRINFGNGAFRNYSSMNGRLRTVSSGKGTTTDVTYTYDYHDDGRLRSVEDSRGWKVTYDQYDGIGRKKQVTLYNGAVAERVFTREYDTLNRPWLVHLLTRPGEPSPGQFEILYDKLGRRQTVSYPNGLTATYGYDELDRLTSLVTKKPDLTALLSLEYPLLDKVGNRKTFRRDGIETTYEYDNIYRLILTPFLPNNPDNYDEVGNRKLGPGAKDGDYLHEADNRMTHGRKYGYIYNNAGNQTDRTQAGVNVSDKSWRQNWNDDNQLESVVKAKGSESRTVTFKYDPFGRRIEKQLVATLDGTPATTRTSNWEYFYDDDNIVLEIYSVTDQSGTTEEKTYYSHGPSVDEHLALERGGQFYYYHADGLGSVTTITDSNRNVVQSYEYDTFGLVKPSTSFRNGYTYTGREWDKETGLYYYRARYYDPMDGRFISVDPVPLKNRTQDQMNSYSYAANNPINFTDPNGENIYGNWCGPGGSGPTQDGVDRICKKHDKCFDKSGATWINNVFGTSDKNKEKCMDDCNKELCEDLNNYVPISYSEIFGRRKIMLFFRCSN